MSYTIYRRENGPFWDWHYSVEENRYKGSTVEIGTAWTIFGARRIVIRHKKQNKTVILARVESWD